MISLNRYRRRVLLLALVMGLCGCRHDVRQITLLRTPLAPDISEPSSQSENQEVPLSSLSQIVTLGPDRKILSSRDLLSLVNLPVETNVAADIHTVAPQVDIAGALRLLGIDSTLARNSATEFTTGAAPGIETGDVANSYIEITFSDVQDQRLETKSLFEVLKSGQIQQGIPQSVSTVPKNNPIYSYLVVETQSAKRINVVLPKGTPLELVNAIQENPLYKPWVNISKAGERWQLGAPLSPPRVVAVGVVALQAHHSKTEYLAPVDKTEVQKASDLGWVEALPEPTDFWYSPTPGPTMTVDQGRNLLNTSLQTAGLSTGKDFKIERGIGTVTKMESLQGENSTNFSTPRFLSDSFRWKSFWCRPWDCSIGTTREFVLIVGHSPDPAVQSTSKLYATDYVKQLQRQPKTPLLGSTCYALAYIYNEHWSGRLERYSLSQTGHTAQEHLKGAQLNGVLQCRQ